MANYPNATTSDGPLYMDAASVAKYEQELATQSETPPDGDTSVQVDPTPNQAETQIPWDKRYGDLKSHADRTINAKQQEIQQKDNEIKRLKEQVNAQQASQPLPVTEAELAKWLENFPDLGKVFETMIMKNNKVVLEKVNARAEQAEAVAKELAVDKAWSELLRAHPDAKELNDDPVFISWVESQEPELQSLIYSPDPKKISKGLDLYKKLNGIKAKSAQDIAKENSRNVPINSKPDTPREKGRFSESQVAKMPPKMYARLEDEINLARQEGRFDYDLSN